MGWILANSIKYWCLSHIVGKTENSLNMVYIEIYRYMFKYMVGVRNNECANYFKLCQTISYHYTTMVIYTDIKPNSISRQYNLKSYQ